MVVVVVMVAEGGLTERPVPRKSSMEMDGVAAAIRGCY